MILCSAHLVVILDGPSSFSRGNPDCILCILAATLSTKKNGLLTKLFNFIALRIDPAVCCWWQAVNSALGVVSKQLSKKQRPERGDHLPIEVLAGMASGHL